jgi:multimeric flavodoxin WrbA
MRVLIHDLQEKDSIAAGLDKNDTTLISDNGTIRPCMGCYGCWIKTPGQCVLQDGYQGLGALYAKCDTMTIISRCVCGSYSPFVVNVLNRSIPCLLPFFVTIGGETHHQRRYKKDRALSVHFYGPATEAERETAKKLVKANSVNFWTKSYEVFFHENAEAIKGVF